MIKLIYILLIIAFSSCVTYKDIATAQGEMAMYTEAKQLEHKVETHIQKQLNWLIWVSGKEGSILKVEILEAHDARPDGEYWYECDVTLRVWDPMGGNVLIERRAFVALHEYFGNVHMPLSVIFYENPWSNDD